MKKIRILCLNCGPFVLKNFGYNQCPNCGGAVKIVTKAELKQRLAKLENKYKSIAPVV